MTKLVLVGEAVADVEEKPSFDAFWLIYPKRVAKLDAQKAWARLTGSEQLAAVVGLVAWRQVWLERGEMQYVPHAATWLNGHRWEDELPEQWVKKHHASHVQAAIPESGERSAMPQHVRDLIAKLRK